MPSIAFATTSIVLLIQNVITKEFLMYDGSNVVTHGIQFHLDNFHLISTGSGTANYIQLLTNTSVKISLPNVSSEPPPGVLPPELSYAGTMVGNGATELNTGADCIVNADTNSTENQWYIEDLAGSINTGVRLYLLREGGERWYLRAPLTGGTVDLVCEDYVTSIANLEEAFFYEQELKFDLVASSIMDFIHTQCIQIPPRSACALLQVLIQ